MDGSNDSVVGDPPANAVSIENLDFGQDWADMTSRPTTAGPDRPADTPEPRSGRVWTVVIDTLTGPNHERDAVSFMRTLPRIDPRLSRCWHHATDRGSMVLLGKHADREDPRLESDLQWLRSLESGGKRIFPRVIRAPVDLGSGVQDHPYALSTLRKLYPTIDPLYSLQIGVWGSFEGAIPWQRACERAEARVRELRARQIPAYLHINEHAELAMVTVDVFDRTAIDVQSGLRSEKLIGYLRQFPVHLTNGEETIEPGVGPVTPSLVVVPRR